MRTEKIKEFMFGIIKNDFGYEFNPEWHWDILELEKTYLDDKSILLFEELNGEVIATIAGRPYDKSSTLGIWRHYVKKELRGKGIGTKLLQKFEKKAKEKGYKKLYLHTQKTITGSLEYWLSKGYKITLDSGDELQTVHLEKILS